MPSLLTGLLFAGPAQADRGDRQAVEATLAAWTQATDVRDADAIETLFLPTAVQTVQLGDKQLTLTTEAYLGMIRAGKIGGGETRLIVHDVAVRGSLATALTTRQGGELTMVDAVVLERTDGAWRIASASVRATPR